MYFHSASRGSPHTPVPATPPSPHTLIPGSSPTLSCPPPHPILLTHFPSFICSINCSSCFISFPFLLLSHPINSSLIPHYFLSVLIPPSPTIQSPLSTSPPPPTNSSLPLSLKLLTRYKLGVSWVRRAISAAGRDHHVNTDSKHICWMRLEEEEQGLVVLGQ